MVVDAGLSGAVFLVARVLFGGLLAFQGLNHFTNVDAMAAYSESKGVPVPRLNVFLSGGMLVFGGLGVALGAFPVVAAGAVALFLVGATPLMHDFWAVPEDQQQSEMTNFIKNVELFAASLVFLVLGGESWAYAVGIGLGL